MNGPTQYELKLGTKKHHLSFIYDRPTISSIVDPKHGFSQLTAVLVLAFFTSFLACRVSSFFEDISQVVLWFVVACAQYSLIKSVGSDPSSSILEDRLIAYSRATYFCTGCVFILIFDKAQSNPSDVTATFYGIPTNNYNLLHACRQIATGYILVLPAIFFFGHLPRITTLLHFLFEQFDIHVFGGYGTISLTAAFLSFAQDVVTGALVWLPCWRALVHSERSSNAARDNLFSLFVALVMAVSFLRSRLPSNISLWRALAPRKLHKRCSMWLSRFTEHSEDQQRLEPSAEVQSAPKSQVASTTAPDAATALAALSESTMSGADITDASEDVNADVESNHSDEADVDKSALEAGRDKVTVLSSRKLDDASAVPSLLKREVDRNAFISIRHSWDLLLALTCLVVVFVVHLSHIFTDWEPNLLYICVTFAVSMNILRTAIMPQLRKPYPLTLFRSAWLRSKKIESMSAARVQNVSAWYEQVSWMFGVLERSVAWPIVVISSLTEAAPALHTKFGSPLAALLLAVAGMKFARLGFSSEKTLAFAVVFSLVFFREDYAGASETLPVDVFFVTIFTQKLLECYDKVQFVITYNTFWNFGTQTRSSLLHFMLYPLTLPHSGMLVVQCMVASFFSAAVYPMMGSSLFLVTALRPIRFWERDYATKLTTKKQADSKAGSAFDSSIGANNLNSVYYKQMLQTLQDSLANDVEKGRWGNVSGGDIFFIIDHDNAMSCFIHIIESGNGHVSFQMRGLEFAGTYCQSRELEAMREDLAADDGYPKRMHRVFRAFGLLKFTTLFTNHWRTWEHPTTVTCCPATAWPATMPRTSFRCTT